MAIMCDICGKKPLSGNLRSHSMRASKRRFLPNLQKIRAEIDGEVKNIKICTACLKRNTVKKIV
ncbi:MAG: 50S ribosomal protein L28 [Candidatus Cloacimonadales bacterium]|jgi:large subunit ribosomal protein L28|nr:50S ribosomal protein L28 [Candidatus Cloacimonadota bacterium]MDD2649971.1 50S ribosomal protein L28 [Candidatus Cloacimonadota bacterium]MDD3501559.1 50S ribosomal protein L28 [Candidatus Cloacimonadota bacterium]MDX9976509.1 50S ribosomal protein L28 [Candidatus Cloacimonadales bacterium]